jgi:hypothetical protein
MLYECLSICFLICINIFNYNNFLTDFLRTMEHGNAI